MEGKWNVASFRTVVANASKVAELAVAQADKLAHPRSSPLSLLYLYFREKGFRTYIGHAGSIPVCARKAGTTSS